MWPTILESFLLIQNSAEAQPSFCEHSEYRIWSHMQIALSTTYFFDTKTSQVMAKI